MMALLDRLNLRPNERRFVVVVFLVLFVVLNIFLVLPRFDDWGAAGDRMFRARGKLERYNAEVRQMPEYQNRIKTFEEENPTVPPEDQSLQFVRLIQSQAAMSGVTIIANARATTKTNNEFFIEQLQTVSIQANETNLVNFLYSLGSGESLIRVRELSLRPDPPRQNLNGNITLVASYQRKPPTKPAPATSRPGASAPPPASPAPAAQAPVTPRPKTQPLVAKPIPRKPGVTNIPAASPRSWWSKVTGWFGSSSTTTGAVARPVQPAPSTNKKP